MKGLLAYIPGNSIFHKMHPIIKLLFAILICASCFVNSSFEILIGLIVLNLIFGAISGKEVFKRTLGIFKGLLKISVFLFIIQVLVIRTGEVIVPIGKNFGLTNVGIVNGLLLVLRLMGATMPLSIMITDTDLNDLSNTLVSVLHIPYKYAYTFTTAIRFIPVFSSEMNIIIEAQKSRGVDFDVKNPFKKMAMIVPLCFPLLISSVRKIDDTAVATELRGFDLRNAKSCSKVYKIHLVDVLGTLFAVAVLASAIIFKDFAIFIKF